MVVTHQPFCLQLCEKQNESSQQFCKISNTVLFFLRYISKSCVVYVYSRQHKCTEMWKLKEQYDICLKSQKQNLKVFDFERYDKIQSIMLSAGVAMAIKPFTVNRWLNNQLIKIILYIDWVSQVKRMHFIHKLLIISNITLGSKCTCKHLVPSQSC